MYFSVPTTTIPPIPRLLVPFRNRRRRSRRPRRMIHDGGVIITPAPAPTPAVVRLRIAPLGRRRPSRIITITGLRSNLPFLSFVVGQREVYGHHLGGWRHCARHPSYRLRQRYPALASCCVNVSYVSTGCVTPLLSPPSPLPLPLPRGGTQELEWVCNKKNKIKNR